LSICSNETQADFAFTFKALTNALLKHNNYVYRPRALIADAAGAITQGFETAFNYTKGDYLRVVCYVSFYRNSFCVRNEIITDIQFLQLSSSETLFVYAYERFVEKWKSKNDQAVDRFLQYFDQYWVKINNGW
jgi:hypothetical protein